MHCCLMLIRLDLHDNEVRACVTLVNYGACMFPFTLEHPAALK